MYITCDCTTAYNHFIWSIRFFFYILGMDHCASQPCLHGGTCVNNVTDFWCDCPSPWSGQSCEQGSVASPLVGVYFHHSDVSPSDRSTSVYASVCVCLSVFCSVCLPVCLSTWCQFLCLSICLLTTNLSLSLKFEIEMLHHLRLNGLFNSRITSRY